MKKIVLVLLAAMLLLSVSAGAEANEVPAELAALLEEYHSFTVLPETTEGTVLGDENLWVTDESFELTTDYAVAVEGGLFFYRVGDHLQEWFNVTDGDSPYAFSLLPGSHFAEVIVDEKVEKINFFGFYFIDDESLKSEVVNFEQYGGKGSFAGNTFYPDYAPGRHVLWLEITTESGGMVLYPLDENGEKLSKAAALPHYGEGEMIFATDDGTMTATAAMMMPEEVAVKIWNANAQ